MIASMQLPMIPSQLRFTTIYDSTKGNLVRSAGCGHGHVAMLLRAATWPFSATGPYRARRLSEPGPPFVVLPGRHDLQRVARTRLPHMMVIGMRKLTPRTCRCSAAFCDPHGAGNLGGIEHALRIASLRIDHKRWKHADQLGSALGELVLGSRQRPSIHHCGRFRDYRNYHGSPSKLRIRHYRLGFQRLPRSEDLRRCHVKQLDARGAIKGATLYFENMPAARRRAAHCVARPAGEAEESDENHSPEVCIKSLDVCHSVHSCQAPQQENNEKPTPDPPHPLHPLCMFTAPCSCRRRHS